MGLFWNYGQYTDDDWAYKDVSQHRVCNGEWKNTVELCVCAESWSVRVRIHFYKLVTG